MNLYNIKVFILISLMLSIMLYAYNVCIIYIHIRGKKLNFERIYNKDISHLPLRDCFLMYFSRNSIIHVQIYILYIYKLTQICVYILFHVWNVLYILFPTCLTFINLYCILLSTHRDLPQVFSWHTQSHNMAGTVS